MSECPHCHCDPIREFHAVNCKTNDHLKKHAAKQTVPIRASHIGAEYEPDHRNPVLVIRDEHGVLRAVSSYTPIKGDFVRGNLKGYGDMLELKLEAEQ